MRKPGCIEPVVYFVNANHHVILAAYSSQPEPPGYMRGEVDTLAGVDRLERVLQRQQRDETERELIIEAGQEERRRAELRDRLYARMTSGDCPAWERDFLREWMKLKDEQRRKKWAKKHEQMWILWARHNDTPKDRGVDEETVNPDRIDVN